MIKVVINGKVFQHFSEYELSLQYNAVADSFKLTGLRQMMPYILDYAKCEIYDKDDNLYLTGTLVSTSYLTTSIPEAITYTGYSKAGILEDCTIGIDQYPLQVNNLSLKQICDNYLPPFDIKYSYSSNVSALMNKKFKEVTSSISSSIQSFLTSLSNQRGIILTHDKEGNLYFTKADTKKEPLYKFTADSGGYTSMSYIVDGQQLHSEITVFKQASIDNPDSGQTTIKNPYVTAVYRPTVKTLSDGNIFDIEKMARMELSKELASFKLIVELPFFIAPGELIEINNPTIGIDSDTLFFIEETIVVGNSAGEKYSITCTLAEVYTLIDL